MKKCSTSLRTLLKKWIVDLFRKKNLDDESNQIIRLVWLYRTKYRAFMQRYKSSKEK